MKGLLLGAVGPVGAHLFPSEFLPHMRFVPATFLLADREDKDAYKLLMELFSAKFCHKMKYCFFDITVLQGVQSSVGSSFVLKRCLEHVDREVKAAAHKAPEGSSKVRLSRPDLLLVIVEAIEFSAWLLCLLEFDAYWNFFLQRTDSSRQGCCFNEPEMAKYLRERIMVKQN